ncbi:hypothetical protein BKK81_05370 [Cupriavidus sp. USMAHM13]|nr:hypothetical protein BKK81_05370 [Cupriavidus sp. USMAHM13]
MPAGTAVHHHFTSAGDPVQQEIAQRPELPQLEPAIQRVVAELRALRAAIAAGARARSEQKLRALIESARQALQSATADQERTARRVMAGVDEMRDAEAAMAKRTAAYGQLDALNAELAARKKADEAAANLAAIMAQLK